MTIVTLAPPSATVPPTPAAHALEPHQRLQLVRDLFAGDTISAVARDHDVSRKFVSQQLHQADQARADAFAPDPPDDEAVFFYLPVTVPWLKRLIVALLLI